MCGARTVPCKICGEYIQNRLINKHMNVMHDIGYRKDNKNKEIENEFKKRKQIEEDEILARKLDEEYGRYNMKKIYNSFRNF